MRCLIFLLAQPVFAGRTACQGMQRAGSARMSSTLRPAAEGSLMLLDAGHIPASEAAALVPQITDLANWAYRGKHADADERAWTGERHLIDGVRTSNEAVRAMLSSVREVGPEQEMLILAVHPEDVPSTTRQRLVGTIHAKRTEVDGVDGCEFGFFAVDPDLQGEGIGSLLLSSAEHHASHTMGVAKAVLWVISVRSDLVSYYERRGYVRTEETAPFPPPSAGVGTAKRSDLEFVRLTKQLPSS